MNHDTITSLRNFVESAQYVRGRASSHSKLHSHYRKTSQVSTRSSSFSEAEIEAGASSRAASVHGGETETPRINTWSFVRNLSLRSVVAARDASAYATDSYGTFMKKSTSKSRKTSNSLPEILRQTTLEEFLQAIERVKASQILTEDFSGSNMNNDESDIFDDLSVTKDDTEETDTETQSHEKTPRQGRDHSANNRFLV